jgi:hypothetical protein
MPTSPSLSSNAPTSPHYKSVNLSGSYFPIFTEKDGGSVYSSPSIFPAGASITLPNMNYSGMSPSITPSVVQSHILSPTQNPQKNQYGQPTLVSSSQYSFPFLANSSKTGLGIQQTHPSQQIYIQQGSSPNVPNPLSSSAYSSPNIGRFSPTHGLTPVSSSACSSNLLSLQFNDINSLQDAMNNNIINNNSNNTNKLQKVTTSSPQFIMQNRLIMPPTNQQQSISTTSEVMKKKGKKKKT